MRNRLLLALVVLLALAPSAAAQTTDPRGVDPKVGSWWPERALTLARYATDWIRPPRGTRFGLFRRYPVRELAGDGYR